MRIHAVRGGEVAIGVDPADCLLLAEACRHAADERQEDKLPSLVFYNLACYFDALALVGAAGTMMNPDDLADFALPAVRAAWSAIQDRTVGPAWLATAKGAAGCDR